MDRFRVIHNIATETHSVLYQYNKENLKSFFQCKENVIILDYFLSLARSVLIQGILQDQIQSAA